MNSDKTVPENKADVVDHLQTAKNYMSETNGTHPTEFVKAKALAAIAEVLIHIAENGVGSNER